MFESVLERNVPARQIGGGATLAFGVHALVVIAAICFSARRPAAVIEKPIGNLTLFRQPAQLTFTDSTAPVGDTRTPHARSPHRVLPSTPANVDRSRKAPDPASSMAPSNNDSGHGNSNPGPASDGAAAVGTGGDSASSGGGAVGATVALPFGEGMKRPVPIAQPAPVYTREARAVKAEGVVSVRCIITVEGTLKDCRVVHGLPYMDAAVLEALAHWKYTPVTFQGRPVSVYYPINLRLVAP